MLLSLALTFTVFLILFLLYAPFNVLPQKNVSHRKKNLPILQISTFWHGLVQLFFRRNKEFDIHAILFQYNRSMNHIYNTERIIGVPFFRTTFVHIFKPEYLEGILNSTTVISKSWLYNDLVPWIGNGLLLSTGHRWRQKRKFLTPAFHFKILETFFPVFNEQCNVLIEKIKIRKNEPFDDIIPSISLCTLDIIGETAMGKQINSQSEGSEYATAIKKIENAVGKRAMTPWLWPDFIFYFSTVGREYRKAIKVTHSFTKKVILDRRKELEKEGDLTADEDDDIGNLYIQTKKRRPLLDLLLYNLIKGKITEEDVEDEVNTFMFAGHDTTAMGISWTLYNVGLYPDVQSRVQQEQYSIFGEDKDRYVTPEDVREMKYLDCVIKESMRLYPPVPLFSRAAGFEFKINGVTFPKNAVFVINTLSIHRDPELFEDPEIFKPERFLPENSIKRHPLAYLPFSAGPRNCIGQRFAIMEQKTILSYILRHFRVESLDPPDKIVEFGEVVLRPKNGLRVRFIER